MSSHDNMGEKKVVEGGKGTEKLHAELEETKKELYKMVVCFKTLFQKVPDPLFILSPDGIFIDENKLAEELTGYKRKEIVGKKVLEIFPNVKIDGESNEIEIVCKNGNKVWVEVKTMSMDMNGKRVVLWVARDITERKKAEEKIKHLNLVLRTMRSINRIITSEKKLSNLLHKICNRLVQTRAYVGAWIAILDADKKLIELIEAGIGEKACLLRETFEKGELIECVKRALNRKGVVIIRNTSACNSCPFAREETDKIMTARLEYGGKIYGIMSVYLPEKFALEKEEQELFAEVVEDVSLAIHSIKVREALKEEEALRKAILSASPVGIGFTVNRVLGWANETMYKMTGYTPEETLGKSARMLYENDEEFERVGKEMEKAFKKGKTAKIETRWKRKDGSAFDCSLYICPINAEKPEEGVVVIAIDMTERKKMEEELRKAYEQEKEFKLKTAHYFFNPIVIAKGYLEVAKEEENKQRILEAIDKAIDAINRIERVVKNVIEKGEIRE